MYVNVSVLETRGIVAFHHWRSQCYTSLADCVDCGVSDGSRRGEDRDGSLSLLVTGARWGVSTEAHAAQEVSCSIVAYGGTSVLSRSPLLLCL